MSSTQRAEERATLRSLDTWVEVETPEQIAFSYAVAGIGSRGAAGAIDAAICVVTLIVLFLVTMFAVGFTRGAAGVRGRVSTSGSGGWLLAAYMLVQFVVIWGYYVLFEGIWDGQTPGKRVMKLRVVRDGGFSVSFAASAVRNLIRVIDAMPIPLYVVGIVAAMLSKSRKRLGDLVAGTIVIKEGHSEAGWTQPEATARAGEHAIVALTTKLNDDEYALLDLYASRRGGLDQSSRQAIASQLASRFARDLSVPPGASDSGALMRLHEEERAARASGVASRSDTGAKREQHAIVALGLKRWNDFAAALDRGYSRKLKRMPPEDVSRLVAQYRDVTTDLARLQTATRGRNSDGVFFLNRLVARGHNLLYRQRGHTAGRVVRYMTVAVPREVRRSWRQIAIAAVLLFAPAGAAYTAVVHNPSIAEELLPDEMLARANTGSAREKRGEGYVDIPAELRPVAASGIIANNVQITYTAFALGLTAGIGTVLLLVFNGVAIGSGVGLFASRGIAHLILAFVAPHGVLELTAICIAAGGGLLIAQGMLLPGERTRREALVENGGRAINLIAASTLLLLVAGTLEGLVSPRVWPMEWKTAVSATTAVAMLFYLSLGRSGKVEHEQDAL